MASVAWSHESAPLRLYQRIGFDPTLEALAFSRLAELDLDGTRAAFSRLIESLDFSKDRSRPREAILLLFDILHRVNRRLHRVTSDEPSFHAYRLALIEQFATLDDPDSARQAFLPALNRLLGPLRSGRSGHPLAERALAYIEDNFQRRISLSQIARRLNVSPNYLSRLFRRETGMTVTAAIHKVRLEQARLLLAAGGRSISEIAYLVGYQNYRDFYRNFVRFEKASPRQIQRRLSSGGSRETPSPKRGSE